MKKIIFTDEQLNEIYVMYNNGFSLRQIQEKYCVSQTVLDRIFKENKWEKRTQTEHFKKYSVDEHIFDVVDTPNKAYCLGLLYADGCNCLKKKEITIELQARDKVVLEEINALTKNTRPLAIIKAGKYHRKQDTYKLLIRSSYMCEQLNKLGCTPRKSLTLDFPTWITNELFPFFLKGYIDGDGWIQKYLIGFMSSDKFCYGAQRYLLDNYKIKSTVMDMKRHYNEHTKTLYICNKKNIYPLTKLMFSENTFGIPRKIDKYREYGFLQDINNSLTI